MHIWLNIFLSVIGLTGFINPVNQLSTYSAPINQMSFESPKKVFINRSPLPVKINSNQNTTKIQGWNLKGESFVTIPPRAADKSPVLTRCDSHPALCITPLPTPSISIPQPTCISRPQCLDATPPCQLMPPRDGFLCPEASTPEVTPTPNSLPVVCAMDARLCPDGNYVGRIPPTCGFAACPSVNIKPSTPWIEPDPLPLKPGPVRLNCPSPVNAGQSDREQPEPVCQDR